MEEFPTADEELVKGFLEDQSGDVADVRVVLKVGVLTCCCATNSAYPVPQAHSIWGSLAVAHIALGCELCVDVQGRANASWLPQAGDQELW